MNLLITNNHPMKHIIKSVNPSFEDMLSGQKNFEILLDEKGTKYKLLDILIFEEYDYRMQKTGRVIEREIAYIFIPDFLLAGFIIVRFTDQDS
jgi:hypothetical protein